MIRKVVDKRFSRIIQMTLYGIKLKVIAPQREMLIIIQTIYLFSLPWTAMLVDISVWAILFQTVPDLFDCCVICADIHVPQRIHSNDFYVSCSNTLTKCLKNEILNIISCILCLALN